MALLTKEYVEGKLIEVLKKVHTNPVKWKVRHYRDRFNFSCVYCGDSEKDPTNFRGNIKFDNNQYKCFNCFKNSNFLKICRDFSVDIDVDIRIELSNAESNHKIDYKKKSDSIVYTHLDKLIDFSKFSDFLNTGEHFITNFSPVKENGIIDLYLNSRGITKSMRENIYEAVNWKNADYKEPVICILNRRDDKLLGMQIRNLKDGKYRSFKIFNYETIHKWLNPEESYLEQDEYDAYNKLSYYFNILNISFDDTISIFEGYLDSIFYPNSIGVTGVNTPTDFFENNSLDIQFFYDNDDTGYIKSEDKIKSGFKVFLWKKLFDDLCLDKSEPYKFLNRLQKIKDLNKLATIYHNPYKTLKLNQYFSKDILDIKWLPKIKKTYKVR